MKIGIEESGSSDKSEGMWCWQVFESLTQKAVSEEDSVAEFEWPKKNSNPAKPHALLDKLDRFL